MKKLLAIFLVLALTLSIIGCGNGKPSNVGTHHYELATKALEVIDQYLDYDLTAEEAHEKIERIAESAESVAELDAEEEQKDADDHDGVDIMGGRDGAILACINCLESILGLSTVTGEEDFAKITEERNDLAEYIGVKAR